MANGVAAVEPMDKRAMRLSLVFVWLWTAAASLWELHGQSRALLMSSGVSDMGVSNALVLSGAAADVFLGLCLWLWPRRAAYLSALATMAVMTLAATLLSPDLWLHPMGPLSKNIPMATMLWVLARKPV